MSQAFKREYNYDTTYYNTYSALPLITDAKITPSLSAAQENGFHFQRTDVGLRFSGSYIYACNTLLV